jgi:hypothetical protein
MYYQCVQIDRDTKQQKIAFHHPAEWWRLTNMILFSALSESQPLLQGRIGAARKPRRLKCWHWVFSEQFVRSGSVRNHITMPLGKEQHVS